MEQNTGIAKRAQRERNVVDACKKLIGEKVDSEIKRRSDLKDKCESIRIEIQSAVAAGEDDVVLERMLDDYDYYSEQQEFSNTMCAMFSSLYKVLGSFVNQLDAMLNLGWYRAVIRYTPERKLPKLITSENQEDLRKVMKIVLRILEKTEGRASAMCVDNNAYEQKRERIKLVNEEIKRSQNVKCGNVQSRIDAVIGKQEKTTYVMPVPAQTKKIKNNK